MSLQASRTSMFYVACLSFKYRSLLGGRFLSPEGFSQRALQVFRTDTDLMSSVELIRAAINEMA